MKYIKTLSYCFLLTFTFAWCVDPTFTMESHGEHNAEGMPFALSSFDAYIEGNENIYSADLAGLQYAIDNPNPTGEQGYLLYGNKSGNDYFQFYIQHIVRPSLVRYMNALQKAPEENKSEETVSKLIKSLGHIRNKIAVRTKTHRGELFGMEPKSGGRLCDQIWEWNSSRPLDQSWLVWRSYLEEKLGVNAIDFSKDPTMDSIIRDILPKIITDDHPDLSARMGHPHRLSNLSPYRSPALYIETSWEDNRPYVGHYSVGGFGDKSISEKSEIPISFWHAPSSHDSDSVIAMLFLDMLKEGLSKESLQRAIGEFLFYWSHATIYYRGQAGVGEWIIQSMAECHGYNLIFSESWRGKSNGTMAPDMQALRRLDPQEFLTAFMEHTTLEPLA